MAKYFDADGNPVEGVLPPEEAKTLTESVAQKDKEAQELKEKLAKLENKDYNFKKLRDMTDEEVEKLSVVEKNLIERSEKLEEETRSWTQRQIDSHKADALAVLVGDDSELQKKVEFHYGRISDPAVTREEIAKKMREAYLLATGGSRQVIDPINRAASYSSNVPANNRKSSEFTQDQRDLAAKLGITDEDLKKVK